MFDDDGSGERLKNRFLVESVSLLLHNAAKLSRYLDREKSVEFIAELHNTGGRPAELCQRLLEIPQVILVLCKHDANQLCDVVCDRPPEKVTAILDKPESFFHLAMATSIGRMMGGMEGLDVPMQGRILQADLAFLAFTMEGDGKRISRMMARQPMPLQVEIMMKNAGPACALGLGSAIVDIIDCQPGPREQFGMLVIPDLLDQLRQGGMAEDAERLIGLQPKQYQTWLSRSGMNIECWDFAPAHKSKTGRQLKPN